MRLLRLLRFFFSGADTTPYDYTIGFVFPAEGGAPRIQPEPAALSRDLVD